jgi:hypothetical protein
MLETNILHDSEIDSIFNVFKLFSSFFLSKIFKFDFLVTSTNSLYD